MTRTTFTYPHTTTALVFTPIFLSPPERRFSSNWRPSLPRRWRRWEEYGFAYSTPPERKNTDESWRCIVTGSRTSAGCFSWRHPSTSSTTAGSSSRYRLVPSACHVSYYMYDVVSCTLCHISCVMCHGYHVTSNMSYVTCH